MILAPYTLTKRGELRYCILLSRSLSPRVYNRTFYLRSFSSDHSVLNLLIPCLSLPAYVVKDQMEDERVKKTDVCYIDFFFQKYNYTMNRRSLSQTTFNLLENSKDYFKQKQIPACLFLTP